jgi:pimeloyl-ACP methyl ester carboxylesterase
MVMTQKSAYPVTRHHTKMVDGVKIFYREAGPKDGPAVLLLHGFPKSSHSTGAAAVAHKAPAAAIPIMPGIDGYRFHRHCGDGSGRGRSTHPTFRIPGPKTS